MAETRPPAPTIIIVGGLSAGPSAAAKARRENEHARIMLFEKTADISYATCGIPYALSGVIASRDKLLVVRPELLQQRFNIEMHLGETVLDIDAPAQEVITTRGRYHYDQLVFAAGARAVIPPIAGDDGASPDTWQQAPNWSTVRSLDDFDRLTPLLTDGRTRRAVVLGGGLIGVETAENLHKRGIAVTVIEGAEQILAQWSPPFAHFAQTVMTEHGVEVITGHSAQTIHTADGRITAVTVTNRAGQQRRLDTDLLLLSTGIRPNTEMLLRQGAQAMPNGALIVNDQMQTSLPHIYAAGDCVALPNPLSGTRSYLPLGTHSNKAGRTTGINAVGAVTDRYPGGYGTAIVQVFNFTLARTGLTQRELGDRPVARSYIHANATPSYYPDARDMVLEITYEPETGRLLAAEAFGEHGVDKRIDVLATCLYAGLTVEDLPNLDLAYAPPYSPAKDPVVVAGYVAGNHRRHQCAPLSPMQFAQALAASPQSYQLLDVRTASERSCHGAIAGGLHIELDQLRDRLHELDHNRPVYVYCARGTRGYLAALILKHHGFGVVRNLAGGFKAWTMQGYPVIAAALQASCAPRSDPAAAA